MTGELASWRSMLDHGVMRKTFSRPLRAAGASCASLGLIIALGACSSDSDTETFCAEGAALSEQTMPDDPEGMTEFSNRLNKISAPSEIKDDWAVLQTSIADLAELYAGLDEDDPENAMKVLSELGEKVDMEKLNDASESVGKYVDENCDA